MRITTSILAASILAATIVPSFAQQSNAGAEKWADAAELCLQREKIFSSQPGQSGCFITAKYTVFCSSNVPPATLTKGRACKDEANAAVTPARYVANKAPRADEPADVPRARQLPAEDEPPRR